MKVLASIGLISICYRLLAGESDSNIRVRRVIGGSDVIEGRWPWLVSLQAEIPIQRLLGIFTIRARRVYCGGSLLNDRWVLTAAHCFAEHGAGGRNPRNWNVRMGSTELRAGIRDRVMDVLGRIFRRAEWRQWERDVHSMHIHPLYDRNNNWENDIALVRLSRPVPSRTMNVLGTVTIPQQYQIVARPGDRCIVKGWGCTREGGGVTSSARQAHLRIYPETDCASLYASDIRELQMERRLCAGINGSSICQGDSGGPLVCYTSGRWIQVGVASFMHGVRPDRFPSVFTRVSSYRQWIASTIDFNERRY